MLLAADGENALYLRSLQEGSGWRSAGTGMPAGFVPGPVTGLDSGLAVAGRDGRNLLLQAGSPEGTLTVRTLPVADSGQTPQALAAAGGRLYLAVSDGSGSDVRLLVLDPSVPEPVWRECAPPPVRQVEFVSLLVQFNGEEDAVYWLSRNDETLDYFEYSPLDNTWTRKSSPPAAMDQGHFASGIAHLYYRPAEDDAYTAYHTITDTWMPVESFGFTTHPIRIVPGSAVGLLTPPEETGASSLYLPRFRPVQSSIHWVDILILLLYCVGLLYMGSFFSKRETTTHDFFLGGQRIPGWASGLSIVITNISAISLLSLPARSFGSDWTVWPFLLSPLLAAPLVIMFVVPFFVGVGFTTAYEYLEKRFNLPVRVLGSIPFLLYEICRTGVLLVLPSIVLSFLTGYSVAECIIFTGIVATAYTIFGGFEAVVWTDVLQALIMIGGILLSVILIMVHLGRETLPLAQLAFDQGKISITSFDWDLTRMTFIVFILHASTLLNSYVSHQPTVQRFISTKDKREARRALWTAGLSGPSILLVFFIIGTGMFMFYTHSPERLNAGLTEPDQIYAWFIIKELPVGVSGLMLGAIFAATMSSLDSGLSSISTVLVTDYYRRFGKHVTEHRALFAAKILVALFGALGIAFGILIQALDVKYLFDLFFEFAQLIWGAGAGIFLLGILSKRANPQGVCVGFVASAVAVYVVKTNTDVIFYLYGAVGTVTCLAVGYAASLFFPAPDDARLQGLTMHTKTPGQ
jgi:SSS family transporter